MAHDRPHDRRSTAALGTVTFDDDSAIDLSPGVIVELHEGDRTSWVITERLRKLYLA